MAPARDRPAALDLLGYADQLLELLDHLQLPLASVIGFSMGGLVARAFALHYPRTPEKPGGAQQRVQPQRRAARRRHCPHRSSRRTRAGRQCRSCACHAGSAANIRRPIRRRSRRLRQTLADNDPQGYLTTYELFATQDMYRAEDLGSIQAPTLIATGELDPGSTPEMAEQLARAHTRRDKVAVLAEQRHMMPVESPRLVNQLLLEFLETHTPDKTI
jgi:pimeloyl-ACP methyl ester carboxylesterase